MIRTVRDLKPWVPDKEEALKRFLRKEERLEDTVSNVKRIHRGKWPIKKSGEERAVYALGAGERCPPTAKVRDVLGGT